MQVLETHTVPSQEKPIRLQDYAVNIFTTLTTKSALKKAIKKELILLNETIANTGDWLHGSELITLLADESEVHKKPFNLELDVVYEDDYLALINKPAGVLVSGNSFATVSNALVQNLQPSAQKDATRPKPVHRLDYPTSGLLLIGKTNSSIIALNKLFENKSIQKTYLAITIGNMLTQGSLNTPINKKEAYTDYKVLASVPSERFQQLNLVQLAPKTGRRHQLRKQLAALGNPILGDKEYGIKGLVLQGKGLYLHAFSLEFIHPITKEALLIKKETPKKFKKIFDTL